MGKGRAGEKLKRKVYEKHLDKMHAERVSLQEWVKLQGAEGVHRVRGSGRGGQGSGDQGDRAGDPTGVPPQAKVKLPERQKRGGYREPDYPYQYIREKY